MLAPPRDPEFKGIVERANGYLETSFLPGRTFCSPTDFQAQLADWLTRANTTTVRSVGGRPVELVAADQAAMTPLPPVDPPTGLVARVRLARDHYVRVDTCDYSVDPRAIGRFVDVTASLSTVTVVGDGDLVAHRQRPPVPPNGGTRDQGPTVGRLMLRAVRSVLTGQGGWAHDHRCEAVGRELLVLPAP